MYWCSYCQSQHEDGTKSKEHIIPESMFNKSYTLETTCQYWNNYMSHSFEKGIISSKVMRFIIDMFAPKKTKIPKLLGEVSTKDGMTYPLFRIKDQEFLCKSPETTSYKTNEILIKISVPGGRSFEYMLKLPFKYIESFSGASKLSKSERQEKQIEADTIELQKYLNELCKNPGINKEFDAFLKKNNLNGELEPHEIVTEKESIQSQDSIITNALPRKLTFDVELLAKFFIKIALTHTIKEFGNQILQESIAKWMLKYIKSGHIEENFLKQFKEGLTGSDFEALFRKACVTGEILYWWKASPDNCLDYIKSKMTIIPSWSVHHQLSNLLKQRRHDLQYIWTLIRLKTQDIDSTVKNNKEAFRYHSILLKHEQINNQDWTCCQIKLFGGIFDGVVYLTNRFLPFQEGRLVRIEF